MALKNWKDRPSSGSGLYWAYSTKKPKDKPSMRKVKILDVGIWAVTFISGVETYTFKHGDGWLWKKTSIPRVPKEITKCKSLNLN